jgi:predicted ABC-type ATPase
LSSGQLNIERMRLRVAEGGHDVPSDRILARREKSLDRLPWFLAQADEAWLFDYSNAKPLLIGTKRKGRIKLAAGVLSEIQNAAKLASGTLPQ